MAAPAADEAWCRETVPRVMELVSPRLPQRDVCALLAVSPWCNRALVANPGLWEVRIAPNCSPTTDSALVACFSSCVEEDHLSEFLRPCSPCYGL